MEVVAMGKKPLRVMVVDDDPLVRRGLARELMQAGCAVTQASGLEEARLEIEVSPPDVAIVDLLLGAGKPDGFAVLEYLREAAPRTRPVVLTGNATIALAVDAVKLGAVDVFEKGGGTARVILERIENEAGELEPLEVIEQRYIMRALGVLHGSQTETAARLEISRRALYEHVHSGG